MSVKLEKYLSRQRENLDVETPDDSVIWAGIQKSLHAGDQPVKHRIGKEMLIRIRNIAAVAVILFSLGYIGNDVINGRLGGRKVTLSSIDNELGRREKEYMTLVSLKTEEVKSFSGSEDVIIKQLFDEIMKLDAVYDQSMKDLKELGSNERVINTIFNTYEQKIRLLELIILETNKINSHESNSKINL